MDRRLVEQDVEWLRRMRDAAMRNQIEENMPLDVALRLRLLGYVESNRHGQHAITFRGRDELLDRERESIFN